MNYFTKICARYFLLICCTIRCGYSQTCPSNANWELGNNTNWICRYGGYGTGLSPNFGTFYSTSSCINSGGMNAAPDANNRHTLMGTGSGNDANAINPLISRVAPAILFPSGTNSYSFRIGNGVTGGYNWPGPTPAAKNYAQAEAVSLTFTVTLENAGFTFLYAAFFNYVKHATDEEARFEILAKDQAGNNIPGIYYKIVRSDSISNTFFTGIGTYQYTNWTKIGLDLSNYIGQEVTLEFRTSDCFLTAAASTTTSCTAGVCTTTTCYGAPNCITCYNNGNPCTTTGTVPNYSPGSHSAYAYIDAYCSPVTIKQTAFCAGDPATQLCAPSGFLSYTWPSGQPGITNGLNNPCVNVSNPVTGTTYTVTMTSATDGVLTNIITLKAWTVKVNDLHICANTEDSVSLKASVNIPGTYTYTWTPSYGLSCTSCASPVITVIPTSATTYTVTVGSASATCTVSDEFTVTASLISTTVTAINHIPCFGGKSGSVAISPSGGSGAYTYSWSTTPLLTTASVTGLYADTYTLKVSDSKACVHLHTVSITQPSAITTTLTANHVTVFGGSDGSATANPAGGTPNYTYVWQPGGGTTQSISNLSAGTYTVTVLDANACSMKQSVIISQPPDLTSIKLIGEMGNNIIIYPNPAGDQIYIEGVSSGTGIELFNRIGEKVLSQVAWKDKFAINLSGLGRGIYLLRITDPGGRLQTGKLMKN